MDRVWLMAMNELRRRLRDRFGLFWMFVFPMLIALLYGGLISNLHTDRLRVDLTVVDEAKSPFSHALLEALREAGITVHETSDVELARAQVRRSERAAYVVVSAASPPAHVALALGVDPSRRLETSLVRSVLTEALMNVASTAGRGGPHTNDTPNALSHIDTFVVDAARIGPQSPFDIAFPAAALWGVLGCAATFAISLVAERVHGTYRRLRVAPVTRAQILGGKALACFVSQLVVVGLLFVVGVVFFGVRIANPAALLLAACAVAWCFVGITIFVSVLGRTEHSVAGAGWATNVVMAMIGGGMVPLVAMPPWLAQLSRGSPVSWGILAFEGSMWRGFSALDLASPCSMLLATGVFFFGLGVVFLRRSDAE